MRRFYLMIVLALAAVALPACNAASVVNAITDRDGYTLVEDIAYGEGERQRYDLYVPENVSPNAPVLVFFYGGGWQDGEKGQYLFVGQTFASEGVIVAVPNYRTYPEGVFPDFVEDGAAAVAAVRRDLPTHTGQDQTRRIYLSGHSAGGHIASLLALDERYLAAQGIDSRAEISGTIGLSGPYDFLPLREAQYKRIFPRQFRGDSQPVNFVDGGEAPMLLIWGADDDTVGEKNIRSLSNKLRAAGISVVDEVLPGVDHIGTVKALVEVLPGEKPPVKTLMLRFMGIAPLNA